MAGKITTTIDINGKNHDKQKLTTIMTTLTTMTTTIDNNLSQRSTPPIVASGAEEDGLKQRVAALRCFLHASLDKYEFTAGRMVLHKSVCLRLMWLAVGLVLLFLIVVVMVVAVMLLPCL